MRCIWGRAVSPKDAAGYPHVKKQAPADGFGPVVDADNIVHCSDRPLDDAVVVILVYCLPR